jgi:hypothetical protein
MINYLNTYAVEAQLYSFLNLCSRCRCVSVSLRNRFTPGKGNHPVSIGHGTGWASEAAWALEGIELLARPARSLVSILTVSTTIIINIKFTIQLNRPRVVKLKTRLFCSRAFTAFSSFRIWNTFRNRMHKTNFSFRFIVVRLSNFDRTLAHNLQYPCLLQQ